MGEPKEEKPSDYINRFLQQRRKIFLRIPEWDKRLVIEFFLEGEHLQSQIKKNFSSNPSVPSALDEATVTNKSIANTSANSTLPNLTAPHPTASCPFPDSETHSYSNSQTTEVRLVRKNKELKPLVHNSPELETLYTTSAISSFIGDYFNSYDRINILCDRLNIPFNDRKGRTIPEKIHYLVSCCEKLDRLIELSKIAKEEALVINGSVGIDETTEYLDSHYGLQIPGKVFISYSWDSKEHINKVIYFAQALRDDGVDCIIDQFVSSPDNWDRWMLNQIDESEFVLIVCSERYYQRYRGKGEVNKGLGVTWESTLIMEKLYDSQGKNNKFYPIFFTACNRKIIPDGIRTSFYDLSEYDLINLDKDENRCSRDGNYQKLYRLLTKQPYVVPRKLGALKKLETIDRETEKRQNGN